MLADLAAEFPAWHVWRSRDSRGRDTDWNATRRARPRPGEVAAGILHRVNAEAAAPLRSLLEQQCAVEAGDPA